MNNLDLDKDTTLKEIIDNLSITVESKSLDTISVPVFITTLDDLLGAAILFLNFKRGKFTSITLQPHDTEDEMKASYALQLEEQSA
jgi:hypothetical protein